MMQREDMTDWAVNRAQEIVMREGFDLIKSARSLDQNAIRANGMLLAKAIATSLVEASAASTTSSGLAFPSGIKR